MSKKYLYIILIILVLFSMYVCLSNWKLSIDGSIKSSRKEILLNQNEILLNQISIKHQRIDTLTILNSDSSGAKLKSYFQNNKALVVLFDDNACKDCISKELNNVQMLAEVIGFDKILFFTQYAKMKDSKLWKNYWKIEFPVYNSLYSPILLPKTVIKPISLFVLDSTMIPQHIFMPEDTLPEMTKQYYAFVKSLFVSTDSVEILPKGRVSFDRVKYDCGDIKRKEKHKISFLLKNEGKCPIVINKIETSCTCTVPSWDKSPLPPGSTREITVFYNAEKPGFFQQKIFVFSNAENTPHGLIITGKVET